MSEMYESEKNLCPEGTRWNPGKKSPAGMTATPVFETCGLPDNLPLRHSVPFQITWRGKCYEFRGWTVVILDDSSLNRSIRLLAVKRDSPAEGKRFRWYIHDTVTMQKPRNGEDDGDSCPVVTEVLSFREIKVADDTTVLAFLLEYILAYKGYADFGDFYSECAKQFWEWNRDMAIPGNLA